MPDRKIYFCSKFAVKTLRATVANADIGSLYKSLSKHPLKMFVPHASEIWSKSYGPIYTELWAFWKKKTGF